MDGYLLVAAVKFQGLCKSSRVCTISGSVLELCKKMPASTKAHCCTCTNIHGST